MRPWRGVLTILAVLAGAHPAAASVVTAKATDLSHPDAVYQILRDSGGDTLPVEALAYYTEARAQARAGNRDRAMQLLAVAAELDPGFAAPRFALARMQLLTDPRAALESTWRGLVTAFSTFGAQHHTLVSGLLGLLVLVAVGYVVLTAYSVLLHLLKVHHSASEHFGLWFPPRLAGLLALLVLVAPAAWRIGILPLCFTLVGLMWRWMRPGERRWIGALSAVVVAAPLLLWLGSPILFSPLDPTSRPSLLDQAMHDPYSPGLVKGLDASLAQTPDDAGLLFAKAMVERRGEHYREAERLYNQVLESGYEPTLVLNNLGVIAFLRGDYDRAMDTLQRAVEREPEEAAPHFNLSQTYAKKLYFEKADQELSKANGLDFNRIRTSIRRSEGEGSRVMIDEPLPESAFWAAAWGSPRTLPSLPGWMGFLFAGALWLLSPVCIASFLVTFLMGRKLHRSLPSFGCSNCGRPVCRRCLRRVRRHTYCAPCGDVLLRIQSSSYSKLVLESQIRRKRRFVLFLGRLTGWFLPGLHAARAGRSTLGFLLALAATASVLGILFPAGPVTRSVWVDSGPAPWWPEIPGFVLGLAVFISGWTVARLVVRPMESRYSTDPETSESGAPDPQLPEQAA